MSRKNWFIALCAVCGVLLLADFFYDKHAKYPVEALFGSYALAGVVGSVVLVIAGRLLSLVVRREENYYDR